MDDQLDAAERGLEAVLKLSATAKGQGKERARRLAVVLATAAARQTPACPAFMRRGISSFVTAHQHSWCCSVGLARFPDKSGCSQMQPRAHSNIGTGGFETQLSVGFG